MRSATARCYDRGGSTSLAVAGVYVLAGELARAGGDHQRAFPAYAHAMAGHVRGRAQRGQNPDPRPPVSADEDWPRAPA